MIVTAVGEAKFPTLDETRSTLASIYGDTAVKGYAERSESSSIEWWINVNPADETSFSVVKGRNVNDLSFDGVPTQNVRVAAALRAMISGNGRIIALEPEQSIFADLPSGITADSIAAGWRDVAEFDEGE